MRSPVFPKWLLCACLAFGAARLFAQDQPLAVTAALQAVVDRHPLRGAKVRQTIRELGGTMPEELPVADDVKKIESRQRKALKRGNSEP